MTYSIRASIRYRRRISQISENERLSAVEESGSHRRATNPFLIVTSGEIDAAFDCEPTRPQGHRGYSFRAPLWVPFKLVQPSIAIRLKPLFIELRMPRICINCLAHFDIHASVRSS